MEFTIDSDTKIKINRKTKDLSKEALEHLTKEELVTKAIQLQTHNTQLKNIIQKTLENQARSQRPIGGRSKTQRDFDFSQTNKRHIMLKLFYLGWDYQGFTAQEESIKTIEYNLFNALKTTCLIENRDTSNYHRCGRTDKGVSAFCQVISIDVRSNFPKEEQMTKHAFENEMNYCKMLNRVLPDEIKCIAWMPLHYENYSARFDCKQRIYRYFFPRGKLNIDAMQEGCKLLIGIHDFRNICKMDVGNGVVSFIRTITNAHLYLASDDSCNNSYDPTYDVFYLELTGHAFLWHQVRCIMAVLILIGENHEKPSVITELFDVEKNPCKPQYSLATDIPLNLYHCEFHRKSKRELNEPDEESFDGMEDIDTTEWVYEEESLGRVISDLQKQWGTEAIKCSMMREMLRDLSEIYKTKLNIPAPINNQSNFLLQGVRAKEYQTLMTRKKCKSLPNRIEHYVKKRRLELETNDSDL